MFLVLPSTITSSSQKQTITLKITLKANFRSRTQDLLKRWEFLFQLEQLVSQKSASGVGRNCAENFFRGGGRTQGLEEDLQKFLSLSFEQQWGKFWKTFLFLICRKVSKWYFAKVIPRLVLSLNSLFLSGAEWEKKQFVGNCQIHQFSALQKLICTQIGFWQICQYINDTCLCLEIIL